MDNEEPMRKTLGFFLLLWITASAKAMPEPGIKNELTSSKNIVGVATQVISNAMFNVQSDSTTNLIFSPIGYATILSILGQGSVGDARDEIYRILEQPQNDAEILAAYRNTLTEYAGKDPMIAPQFKTWFYIYNNVTSDEKFRKIIEENYLVEVKDIERMESWDNFDDAFKNEEVSTNEKSSNSKDIIQFDDLKNSEPKDGVEVEGFDTLKIADDDDEVTTTDSVEKAIADYDQLNKDEKNMVTKFDGHVDDEQYVDVPVIKKDMQKDGPEKVSLPTKKYMEDSAEIMIAQENRKFESRFGRARPLHLDGDVTSALSGNSIIGKKDGKIKDELEAKMLLFNGLYFRGEWATPFSTVSDKKKFESANGEQDASYMMVDGNFKFADVRSKQLVAVEFPYKNEKYSLMIIMPDTFKDLKYFSKNSDYNLLNEISSQLEPTDVRVVMPKFRVEFTSKADKALGQLGLKTIFNKNSDLRGVSKDGEGYHIEELVQHVAIKVDEGFSSENALTATRILGRVNAKSNEIFINRPFLFYVRDVVNDVVLTAGKIVEIPDEEIAVKFTV